VASPGWVNPAIRLRATGPEAVAMASAVLLLVAPFGMASGYHPEGVPTTAAEVSTPYGTGGDRTPAAGLRLRVGQGVGIGSGRR